MGVKLTRVEIRNYRSVFEAAGAPTLVLSLASGMNALVGPNNCGKSNVLKAIALALEEGHEGTFVRERDEPAQRLWARPTITLDFEVERPSSPEKTLVQRLEAYEQSALQGERKATLASKGRFRLRVRYTKSGRDEFFMTAAGNRRGTPALNEKALEQFRRAVRFILVRSGEDVETFLAGRFKDVLHTVLQESLSSEVKAAEKRREQYQGDVASSLFGPISELVSREIGQMIPEIRQVQLEPRVLAIEETLASAGISLADGARTSLSEKGTGVRGSLLLAMLRYIAEHSRRSVIFAIEEPEAFLHPAAQSEVRDDLEHLSERDDVTLLVTTHSPFVVSRAPAAQIVSVGKDATGRTHLLDACAGDADARSLLGSLFADAALPDFLERSARSNGAARAFLVVEGFTDARYLELAAERCGLSEAAAGIEVMPATGAKAAAVQAVLQHVASSRPVLVLLDYEALTKPYIEMLRDTFGFRPESLMTYREWGPAPKANDPVEAEGLFPQPFLDRFIRQAGEGRVVSEKVRTSKGWRYGLNQNGKQLFLDFVDRKATKDDLANFALVWQAIDERITKLEARLSRANGQVQVTNTSDEGVTTGT